MNKIVLVVILALVVAVSLFIYMNAFVGGTPITTTDQKCTLSGGAVTTQSCCGSASDFPNTCTIGACGCSPENSHDVKVCDCGAGKCWDSEKNACV
jgi:hypothetical protein